MIEQEKRIQRINFWEALLGISELLENLSHIFDVKGFLKDRGISKDKERDDEKPEKEDAQNSNKNEET